MYLASTLNSLAPMKIKRRQTKHKLLDQIQTICNSCYGAYQVAIWVITIILLVGDNNIILQLITDLALEFKVCTVGQFHLLKMITNPH